MGTPCCHTSSNLYSHMIQSNSNYSWAFTSILISIFRVVFISMLSIVISSYSHHKLYYKGLKFKKKLCCGKITTLSGWDFILEKFQDFYEFDLDSFHQELKNEHEDHSEDWWKHLNKVKSSKIIPYICNNDPEIK